MLNFFLTLLLFLPEFLIKIFTRVPISDGTSMDPKQWILCRLSPAEILGGPNSEVNEVREIEYKDFSEIFKISNFK